MQERFLRITKNRAGRDFILYTSPSQLCPPSWWIQVVSGHSCQIAFPKLPCWKWDLLLLMLSIMAMGTEYYLSLCSRLCVWRQISRKDLDPPVITLTNAREENNCRLDPLLFCAAWWEHIAMPTPEKPSSHTYVHPPASVWHDGRHILLQFGNWKVIEDRRLRSLPLCPLPQSWRTNKKCKYDVCSCCFLVRANSEM